MSRIIGEAADRRSAVHSPDELILRRALPHGGIEGRDVVTCLIEQNPSSLVVGIGHLVSGDHRGRVHCRELDATVRVLVGEGSPVQLGTPALILDVELPEGGQVTTQVPAEFQGFAYVLEGEAAFGANRRRAKPPQLVLLCGGGEFTVTDAVPGTRYLLMTGKPYGEVPVFNGPFVD
jgi:hypothetical protein